MEYWLFSEKNKEEINKLLDCQLYNTVLGDSDHFTKPRQFLDIKANTTFEMIEIVASLNKDKKWLINPTLSSSKINFEFIKHFTKNKKELPHIKIAPIIQQELGTTILDNNTFTQTILNVMAYGGDYVVINSGDLDMLEWVMKFRDKGMYKTRIMVYDDTHFFCMGKKESISYDGIIFRNHILRA